jgi:integrase
MPRPATGQVIVRDGERGRVFAIRFRAYGKRRYVTLGSAEDGWTSKRAEEELENVLADVRRGIWQPPTAEPIVEAPRQEPTLHQFATDWYERHRGEVDTRTADFWRWALSHVLEHLAELPLTQVTVERVDAYKTTKVRERERLEAELDAWRAADPEKRGVRPPRPLSNGSINRTLRVLAQVLDDAVEYKQVAINPARGRKRRLKARRPRRIWLELDEVRSLLDAAGNHRALLATMILAGLRVGEACALRWRAVDLARATLTVEESKTDAGEGRKIDLTPMLLDELKAHRAKHADMSGEDLVFATSTGRARDRHNVRARILLPALERANKQRAEAGQPTIVHVTNHTLRRTFASLLYEAGAQPAQVMDQLGHTSAALALEVYAKKMERTRDTGKRMDALLDWAQTSTNGATPADPLSVPETKEAA